MTQRITRVTQRAVQLHGSEISMDLYILAGKALVLNTGFVEKYGVTHLTIAYFKEGLIDGQLEDLNKLDFEHFKKIQDQRMNLRINRNDWLCRKCNFKVFGSKPQCKKCGSLREAMIHSKNDHTIHGIV